MHKISRRIVLSGNKILAASFIGQADKFSNTVESMAALRQLSQHAGRLDISDEISVYTTVQFGQTTMHIDARPPKVDPVVVEQFRKFMCVCSSCFTLGIIESVTKPINEDGHQYSSENRYTVLVCTTDKENQNDSDVPYWPKGKVQYEKGVSYSRGEADFLKLIPAQPSDGAVYEEGELVVLIPHPFGISTLSDFNSVPFLVASKKVVPNEPSGGCKIDPILGALIVPISIKGLANYYFQDLNGSYKPALSNIPNFITTPQASRVSRDLLEISVLDPTVENQLLSDLDYAKNILDAYSVEYAIIEDLVTDQGANLNKAKVQFVSVETIEGDTGLIVEVTSTSDEPEYVRTTSNSDSADGNLSVSFDDFQSLYTLVPKPGQFVYTYYSHTSHTDPTEHVIANADNIAIVLRCALPLREDHNTVLCIHRRVQKVYSVYEKIGTPILAHTHPVGVELDLSHEPNVDYINTLELHPGTPPIKIFTDRNFIFPVQREHICFYAQDMLNEYNDLVFDINAEQVMVKLERSTPNILLPYRKAPDTRDLAGYYTDERPIGTYNVDHSPWGWECTMFQNMKDYYEENSGTWTKVSELGGGLWQCYRLKYPGYTGGPKELSDKVYLTSFNRNATVGPGGEVLAFSWNSWIDPMVRGDIQSGSGRHIPSKTSVVDHVENPPVYLPSRYFQDARIGITLGSDFPMSNTVLYNPYNTDYQSREYKNAVKGFSFSCQTLYDYRAGVLHTTSEITYSFYGTEKELKDVYFSWAQGRRIQLEVSLPDSSDYAHSDPNKALNYGSYYISGTRPQIVAGDASWGRLYINERYAELDYLRSINCWRKSRANHNDWTRLYDFDGDPEVGAPGDYPNEPATLNLPRGLEPPYEGSNRYHEVAMSSTQGLRCAQVLEVRKLCSIQSNLLIKEPPNG